MRQQRFPQDRPASVAEFVADKLHGLELRQRARVEFRKAKAKAKPKTLRPPIPSAVLESIQVHRRDDHRTDSILTQFGCARCTELEELYAQSLRYHAGHAAAEYILRSRAQGVIDFASSAGGGR